MIDIGFGLECMSSNYRIRARVKYFYDETSRYWNYARQVEHAQEWLARGGRLRGAKDEHQLMAYLATPSTDVYVDRLPPTARENFWKLVEWAKTEEATVYTELEGVGFIAPHRNKKLNEHIFVVHGGTHNRMQRDVTRETIELYRVPPKDLAAMLDYAKRRYDSVQAGNHVWGVDPSLSYEQHVERETASFFRQRSYRARTVYLDRLTKVEKEKLSMLKLLPSAKYLDGYGAKILNYTAPVYLMTGDKK